MPFHHDDVKQLNLVQIQQFAFNPKEEPGSFGAK